MGKSDLAGMRLRFCEDPCMPVSYNDSVCVAYNTRYLARGRVAVLKPLLRVSSYASAIVVAIKIRAVATDERTTICGC